jgi:outer membrane receptor for ferrienterochelin and colicin
MSVAILALAFAGSAMAQNSGELSGRVIYEDQGLPGVRITVSSPALQGDQSTVSNAAGDYLFKSLPGGDYRVRFELASFATLENDVRISTSQPRRLDAVMYPEAMQEEIVVTGQMESVSTGAQGSSTVEQSFLEKLPVLRNLNNAVLLSAGTNGTGPGGNVSISGAQSWESLYTINGVVINENTRGQPHNLFIEDAIMETTTITSSASAEYGRFSGGVVNAVTKSGGNEFSGSFRANVTNDSWNGETPVTTEQNDENSYVYEATLGGYILRDALWFFGAGRDRETSGSGQVETPGQPNAGIAYPTKTTETRLEGKLTGSIGPNHRIMASYMDIDLTQFNSSFSPPADFNAIDPERSIPNTGLSLTYTGVLSDNFYLEGLYSKKEYAFVDSGGSNPEVSGSPIWDLLESVSFNDHWFDGAGPDIERNNENYYAKASWFFSGAGTHDLVFGYDYFDDTTNENNKQTASGFFFATVVPQNYDEPGNPYLVAENFGGYVGWGDVLEDSVGSHSETTSLYANDTWRINDKLTVNLGLRYDKNDASDQGGLKNIDDYRISPRLSGSYDLKGDGSIILTAGFNRYAMAVPQNRASDGSSAGNPTWSWYVYGGPTILAGTPEYPTNEDALGAVFDWFFNVYGGVENTDLAAQIQIPGLTPRVGEGLRAPYGDEATIGASFRLGTRGVLRADYVYRKYGSFYAREITPGSFVEVPISGALLDQAVVINDDDIYSRNYNALMARFDYRIGSRWNIGANYTYSKAKGNFNGETGGSGPVVGTYFQYEEYKDPSWNVPDGLLAIDQTHKFNAFVVWDMISSTHHNLSLSLLQSFLSGTPYSATGAIDTIPYVGDPGDLGYLGTSLDTVTYFFSDRGAFRTDNVTRTDIALNYSFFINIGGGQLELFLQPEVINVFNEQAVDNPNTTVYTNDNDSSLATFNPWTETPVEGTNFVYGPNWGEAQREADYQQPRTIRFSVGLRF